MPFDRSGPCRPLSDTGRRRTWTSAGAIALAFSIAAGTHAAPAHAQAMARSAPMADTAGNTSNLDTLVSRALDVSPSIAAARDRASASRARIGPAGARPDPVLGLGITDMPIRQPGFADDFTMQVVRVTQTVPVPGTLSLSKRAARQEAEGADIALAGARLGVVRQVKDAYYELAFLDHALEIVGRNQRLLVDLIRITQAQYGAGKADQQDVLKAQVEAARLADQAVMLAESRRSALARLNAALDRSSETPVDHPAVPERIARAAVADSAGAIGFVSAALGARAAHSPLPPLDSLQERAVRESPMLREHGANIAAAATRVDIARKERWPDVEVSLEYDRRPRFPDFVTAMISIPLHLQQGSRQNQEVAAARAELSSGYAQHHVDENEIRARVAALDSDLERDRAQLAIYVTAILPQGRAALTSASASYQAGRGTFLSVLNSQATLFAYETEYYRDLTDFAKTLAELESVIGAEVLP
jgi:outer membrane protein, heavy metal efflux system